MKKRLILYTNDNTEEARWLYERGTNVWMSLDSDAFQFDVMSEVHAEINARGTQCNLVPAAKMLIENHGTPRSAPNK
jgi:hypothetical protein